MSDLLPGLGPILATIASSTMGTADPETDYANHETNSSWVIGTCLSGLASRNPTEWRSQVDIAAWASIVVEKWGWSGYALDGLVSMVNAR